MSLSSTFCWHTETFIKPPIFPSSTTVVPCACVRASSEIVPHWIVPPHPSTPDFATATSIIIIITTIVIISSPLSGAVRATHIPPARLIPQGARFHRHRSFFPRPHALNRLASHSELPIQECAGSPVGEQLRTQPANCGNPNLGFSPRCISTPDYLPHPYQSPLRLPLQRRNLPRLCRPIVGTSSSTLSVLLLYFGHCIKQSQLLPPPIHSPAPSHCTTKRIINL